MTSKLEELKNCLHDADMRFDIAIRKMSNITNRVHELEVERNHSLRKQFIENEIIMHPNESLSEELQRLDVNDKSILVYEEVIKGYRPMSNRKNVLQEERNQYVKWIEEEEAVQR